jgi:hypothetical protein
MGNFVLQIGSCSFLYLRKGPWEILFPFLLCSSSLNVLSVPGASLFPPHRRRSFWSPSLPSFLCTTAAGRTGAAARAELSGMRGAGDGSGSRRASSGVLAGRARTGAWAASGWRRRAAGAGGEPARAATAAGARRAAPCGQLVARAAPAQASGGSGRGSARWWRGGSWQAAPSGASARAAGVCGATWLQAWRGPVCGARAAVGVRDAEERVSKCCVRRLGWGVNTGSQRGCGSGAGERAQVERRPSRQARKWLAARTSKPRRRWLSRQQERANAGRPE